jgi:hypothetical protein
MVDGTLPFWLHVPIACLAYMLCRSCRARLQQHNKRRRNVGGNSSKKGCRRRGRTHPSNSPPTTSQEEAATAAAAAGLASILPDEQAVGIPEGWAAGSVASSEAGRLLQEQDAALEGFVERLDASAGAMSIDDPANLQSVAASGASGTASAATAAAGGGQAGQQPVLCSGIAGYDLSSSCLFEELAASDATVTWAPSAAGQEGQQLQLPAVIPELVKTAGMLPGSTSSVAGPSSTVPPASQQQQSTGLRIIGTAASGAAYRSLTLEVPDQLQDLLEVSTVLGQQNSPVMGTSPNLLNATSSVYGGTAMNVAPGSRTSQQQQQQEEQVLQQDFIGLVQGSGQPVLELAALLTGEQWAEMEEAVEAQLRQLPPTAAEKLRQLGLPGLISLRDQLQAAVNQHQQQQQQQQGPLEASGEAVHTKTLLDVTTVLVSYRSLRAAAQQQPHAVQLMGNPGGWQYPAAGISGRGLSMSAVSTWAAAAAREQGMLPPGAPLYVSAGTAGAPQFAPGTAAGAALSSHPGQQVFVPERSTGLECSRAFRSDLQFPGQQYEPSQQGIQTSSAPGTRLDSSVYSSLPGASSTAAAAAGATSGAMSAGGGLWQATDQLAAAGCATSAPLGLRVEQEPPAFTWQPPPSTMPASTQPQVQHPDAPWGLDRQYGSDDMLPSGVFMPCSAAAAYPMEDAACMYQQASSSGWDNLSSLDVAARLAPGEQLACRAQRVTRGVSPADIVHGHKRVWSHACSTYA